MSRHFKDFSFTVLHVANLLGCSLKPRYTVRILYVNGSAWESGSLQNDTWIIRNKKWLTAFDCHLLVPGLPSLVRSVTKVLSELDELTVWSHLRWLTLFNTALDSSIWVMFFLIPASFYVLSSVIRRVQNLRFFTSSLHSCFTAVHCNVK